MFDDFAAYYHENVVSAFREYADIAGNGVYGRSQDLRQAMEAASALFHLREHLPDASALSRADAEAACSDYGLLGDIVNAAKHKTLTGKTPHGQPLVSGSDAIHERVLIILYEDADGEYKNIQKTVAVRLVDGTERYLHDVMTNVINFWESKLYTLGLKAKVHTFPNPGVIRFREREECNEGRLDITITQGLRFSQTMQLLRFDNATNAVRPVDLSGSKAEFTVRRPPQFEVKLSLVHEASGEEFHASIPLTEEENNRLAALQSDAERRDYLSKLPTAKEALKKLADEAGQDQEQ